MSQGYTSAWSQYLMQLKYEIMDQQSQTLGRYWLLNYGCGEVDLLKSFIFYRHDDKYRYQAYDPYFGPYQIPSYTPFDRIFCSLVLEHVKDPHETIEHLISLMMVKGPDTKCYIIVPNSQSFHRVVKNQHNTLTEWDKRAGHVRLFTPTSLETLLKQYFEKVEFIPIGFKPVHTDLMMNLHEYWNVYRQPPEILKEYCAEIMMVCQNPYFITDKKV